MSALPAPNLMPSKASVEKTFGLYIHWPFCAKKCPYCDFNSHVWADIPVEEMEGGLLQNLESLEASLKGFRLSSVFFGGGTPSLMPASSVEKILTRAFDLFGTPQSKSVEITLEANPASSDITRFRDFKKAGVNRLSLGIQALDDKRLRFLGRNHDKDTALKAIEKARLLFDNLSLDAIYACPGQTLTGWQTELAHFLSFDLRHFSAYQLTIEPGTVFAQQHKKGLLTPLSNDLEADFYEATRHQLQEAGFMAYEISNFARKGAQSAHNLTCWRYGFYAGIGPGAHGRLPGNATHPRRATMEEKSPAKWLQMLAEKGTALREDEILSPALCWQEALMAGLRLREGLPFARLDSFIGDTHKALINNRQYQLFKKMELLKESDTRLQLTERGFLCLDYILNSLVKIA